MDPRCGMHVRGAGTVAGAARRMRNGKAVARRVRVAYHTALYGFTEDRVGGSARFTVGRARVSFSTQYTVKGGY
eukprot:215193-Prymnesium_polylepis.1